MPFLTNRRAADRSCLSSCVWLPLQKNNFPVLEFVQTEDGLQKAMERKLSMNVEFVLTNPLPGEQPASGGDGYFSEEELEEALPNPDVSPLIVRLADLDPLGESLDDEEDPDGNGLELASGTGNADDPLLLEEDEVVAAPTAATSMDSADTADDDSSTHGSDQSEGSEPDHVNEGESELDAAIPVVSQPTLPAAQPVLVDPLPRVDPSPKRGGRSSLPKRL